jgi:hypothetical protein
LWARSKRMPARITGHDFDSRSVARSGWPPPRRSSLGVIGSTTFGTAAEDHLMGWVGLVVSQVLRHHIRR